MNHLEKEENKKNGLEAVKKLVRKGKKKWDAHL
jgi:hypothetical protein